MMGRSHAMMACAGTMAATLAVWPATTPAALVVWGSVGAGFGVLPDLDEPSSTISRMFGPLSRTTSRFMRWMGVKHREVTHSWILIVLGAMLAWVCTVSQIVAGITMMIAFMLAARLLLPVRARGTVALVWIPAIAASWIAAFGPLDLTPLLLVIPLGILLHDVGDWFTRGKVRFLYPSTAKFGLGLFVTNSWLEHYIVQPILFLLLALIAISWIFIPGYEWVQYGGLNSFIDHLPNISSVVKS